MKTGVRFVLPLVAVLGLLSWAASAVVNATGRSWFEKDVRLRAELAVSGARDALARYWRDGDTAGIGRVLIELTRDERLVAAIACNPELTAVAATPDYPAAHGCGAIGRRVQPLEPNGPWRSSNETWSGLGEPLYVSGLPVVDGGKTLGFVVLIHDMGFAERRASMSRTFTMGAFLLLALAAAVITFLVMRGAWKSWFEEARRTLRGGGRRPEFQPLLSDMRELMSTISSEGEGGGNPWTPARLRNTLKRHLHGERVVMVANREPYIHERGKDGDIRVVHPASGLVTALEPVMRACSGVWVAHGAGSADRETADASGRIWVPPDEKSYQIRRVWLSAEEEKGYYYGLSNEGLWPLCHIAHTRPVFRAEDYAHYQRANQRFADAACTEATSDDPIILVQDYHFALAPKMIRERLPRATILTFWHIPFPNSERFGICPWHKELLEGMLGSSIIGFHTQLHCNNFIEAVDRFLEARIDREQLGVVHERRTTLVRPYPISIEWPNRWVETAPSVADCRASVRAQLGLPEGVRLGVGVDRLDYTKGVEERFLAVERLLERFPQYRGKFTFVQLAAPSRIAIERYRDHNVAIERLAERINERFGTGSYRPIILFRDHHEPPTVFRFYRAADLCYVSSLHDGMNLVSKEFVAARDDEQGVLVLSHFTGAARELTEALIVNPYDLEQTSDALAAALVMPASEQADRMRSMRAFLAHFNVYRWAGRMLIDAATLRQRDRLSGRLANATNPRLEVIG